ncbi:hypothetical protein M434DRAFT_145301 [Hypoxylon sp. CO27-5]|nr:hypothetical protein M434DRAFT_145301 [Hypoxylon sp. CO27-5]
MLNYELDLETPLMIRGEILRWAQSDAFTILERFAQDIKAASNWREEFSPKFLNALLLSLMAYWAPGALTAPHNDPPHSSVEDGQAEEQQENVDANRVFVPDDRSDTMSDIARFNDSDKHDYTDDEMNDAASLYQSDEHSCTDESILEFWENEAESMGVDITGDVPMDFVVGIVTDIAVDRELRRVENSRSARHQ